MSQKNGKRKYKTDDEFAESQWTKTQKSRQAKKATKALSKAKTLDEQKIEAGTHEWKMYRGPNGKVTNTLVRIKE